MIGAEVALLFEARRPAAAADRRPPSRAGARRRAADPARRRARAGNRRRADRAALRAGVADHGEGRADHSARHPRHQPCQRHQPHPRRVGAAQLTAKRVQRVATIAAMVEQHAGDAAFLWVRRRAEVRGRRFGEADLGRLDQRLTAHLAGLVAAGEAGWSAALAQFADWPEAGEVFVLGALALHHGEPALVARALDAGAEAGEAGRSGLSGAVARTPPERLRPFVVEWLASPDPALRWLGAAALSHHRADGRRRLEVLIDDPDPAVHVRALRLVGELGRRDLEPALDAAFGEADEAARFRAAWSACLIGAGARAAPVLDDLAEAGGRFAAPAADVRLATAPRRGGTRLAATLDRPRAGHARRRARRPGRPRARALADRPDAVARDGIRGGGRVSATSSPSTSIRPTYSPRPRRASARRSPSLKTCRFPSPIGSTPGGTAAGARCRPRTVPRCASSRCAPCARRRPTPAGR